MSQSQQSTSFASLLVTDWRQIRHIDIAFHRRLTVLTGANGSGKTTVQNLLSRHFGWHLPFVDLVDLIESLSDAAKASTDSDRSAQDALIGELDRIVRQSYPQVGPGWRQRAIGRLTYTNGAEAFLALQEPPQGMGGQSQIAIFGQQFVDGLNLPAHRSVGGYQQVQAIPTSFNPSAQILDSFVNELRSRFMGIFTQQGRTPLYYMKEALIAAAIYGEGNMSVVPNREALEVFEGFQDTLRQLLPRSIGFRRLYIRSPEVVVSTDTGDFALDAISGGVSAVMELAWQIFLRRRNAPSFVVCIDEPENHLHPELQRVLLPHLVEAFPGVQFIVSTHSPFIVGSVPDSAVYALRFDPEGRVDSVRLDPQDKAGSATEVLRDVLGMTTTLPAWAEARLTDIVQKYSRQPLTSESLEAMRNELSDLGLRDVVPDAVAEVFRRVDRTRDQSN